MPGDDDSTDVEPAWHERTSALVGASVAALAALGVLWLAISYLSEDGPDPTPQYFMEPSVSGSSSTTVTTTTTETITSTSPPVTTDIDPGDTSSTTTSTDSTTSPTTSFNPSNLPRTKSPSTYDDGRPRPRFNETRTLNPRP